MIRMSVMKDTEEWGKPRASGDDPAAWRRLWLA